MHRITEVKAPRGFELELTFEDGVTGLIAGRWPADGTGREVVVQWGIVHQQELLDDWQRARARQALRKIVPLQ